MDDIMGISLKKIIETILAIMALVFFLVGDSKGGEITENLIIIITVVVYLALYVLLSCARRGDMLNAGGSVGLECAAGFILLIHGILAVYSGGYATLTTVALCLNIAVGSLFLLFAIF